MRAPTPRRSRRPLALALAFATAMALGACSPADQPAVSAPTQRVSPPTSNPSPTVTTATMATTAPEPTTPAPTAPPRAPLTGRAGGDRAPVMALKIDNATPARPQRGLGAADVVFEELVEGGTTRFLALFQSRLPEKVGPVRSGREVDAVLLPSFDPLLVFSGAADEVQRDVADAGLALVQDEDESKRYDAAFERDAGREAPYNLYLQTDELRTARAERPPARPPWEFGAAGAKGQPLKGIELSFSPWASAGWTWDGKTWIRSQDGSPHELVDGDVITASNVVVMRVPTAPGGRTDSAGNPTVEITVTGKGDALILRDGGVYRGEWSKRDAESDLVWRTRAGRPLPLAPGNTWIELVPADGDVELVGAKTAP